MSFKTIATSSRARVITILQPLFSHKFPNSFNNVGLSIIERKVSHMIWLA